MGGNIRKAMSQNKPKKHGADIMNCSVSHKGKQEGQGRDIRGQDTTLHSLIWHEPCDSLEGVFKNQSPGSHEADPP